MIAVSTATGELPPNTLAIAPRKPFDRTRWPPPFFHADPSCLLPLARSYLQALHRTTAPRRLWTTDFCLADLSGLAGCLPTSLWQSSMMFAQSHRSVRKADLSLDTLVPYRYAAVFLVFPSSFERIDSMLHGLSSFRHTNTRGSPTFRKMRQSQVHAPGIWDWCRSRSSVLSPPLHIKNLLQSVM